MQNIHRIKFNSLVLREKYVGILLNIKDYQKRFLPTYHKIPFLEIVAQSSLSHTPQAFVPLMMRQ